MRDHLAAADLQTAEEMAAHADTLWDARAGESSVAALSAAVDAVSVRSPARDSRRSPNRDSRRRSPDQRRQNSGRDGNRQPRRQTPGRSSLCFYHEKFGKKADRCEPNCTWSGN